MGWMGWTIAGLDGLDGLDNSLVGWVGLLIDGWLDYNGLV